MNTPDIIKINKALAEFAKNMRAFMYSSAPKGIHEIGKKLAEYFQMLDDAIREVYPEWDGKWESLDDQFDFDDNWLAKEIPEYLPDLLANEERIKKLST